MDKHDDVGRIKLKKIIDKKYPEWKYYDIFKFENQEVTKKCLILKLIYLHNSKIVFIFAL